MTDTPLLLSHRNLMNRRTLPRSLGRWTLDSGGFTELSMFGGWVTTVADYIEGARRYRDEIGNMEWAAIQDWMCEPFIVENTGLSVFEHQERTIWSYLDLMHRAPDVPWMPVLQGWELGDYRHHIDMYADEGIDLTVLPVVGIGSVCRRQGSKEIDAVIRSIAGTGIRLHGFGVKTNGLRLSHDVMQSADSASWSLTARMEYIRLPGHQHRVCNHCLPWALQWRAKLLRSLRTTSVKRVKAWFG